jgi:hypothetical protein
MGQEAGSARHLKCTPVPVTGSSRARDRHGSTRRHLDGSGSRPQQRAGTVHTQVVLVLRWLRHRLDLRTLAGAVSLAIDGFRHPKITLRPVPALNLLLTSSIHDFAAALPAGVRAIG